MIQVGQRAPDFTLDGVLDGEFVEVNLASQRGNWVVLFFYPLDFTFVCPTEIRGFAQRRGEFDELGAKVFGASVDSKYKPSRLVRARARQTRVPPVVRHDARRLARVRRAAGRRRPRCAAPSSSIPRACCATWSCTTTTWGATPKRPCACCRRCRRASCVRSTGGRARRRSRPEPAAVP